MYEMLTGQPPFGGKTAAQILAKHLSQKPAEVSRVSPEAPEVLTGIVARALAKDPGERFPTARAMAEALAGTSAPGALVSGKVQRRRRFGRRLKWAGGLLLIVVLLFVAFVVGAATLVRSMFNSEPPALSLITPNIPGELVIAARSRLQIPATDSVLYLFQPHGRDATNTLAITAHDLYWQAGGAPRHRHWGNLQLTLNTAFSANSGRLIVKDKNSPTVDTVFVGLSTRELSALSDAATKLKSVTDST
jgi:hypothetical protein